MQQTKLVTKVRESVKNYPNKKDTTGKNPTVYVHMISVEGDPQEWEYHSHNPVCTNFVPQQEATFTTEVKVNGAYTNYRIAPFTLLNKPSFKKFEQKDQGAITALSCLSSACNYYQQRNGSEAEVMAFAEKMFQWANSKSTK